MFRTRQAPSPTGYLHIGTARTVLFTTLFAKINDGIWYLRLEDTDRNRLQPESVKILLSALTDIGLSPDEGLSINKTMPNQEADDFYGVYQNGEYGSYIQSERLSYYHQVAQGLIDQKLAYWSYLTPEDKQELQEIKAVTKFPINYFKVCTQRFADRMYQSVADGLADNQKPVLMYNIQRDQKITCHDELLGDTVFDLNLEEDFTALKSDGYPTYHLAHLVDDFMMKTTTVIRSQEWLPSLPKHQTMFLDYWKSMPKYIHLPFILSEKGNKKMSKRDGNVNMQGYLDNGFVPEAIVNYLAFLGWNPGTEQELYLTPQDF